MLSGSVKLDFTYEDLFRFIRLNVELREKVDAITGDDPAPQLLLSAIQQADFSAESFSKSNCHIHLLYLFKHGLITREVFLSVYNYLMALMEFTDRQLLKETDKHLKCTDAEAMKMVALVEDNKISDVGKLYVEKVCTAFKDKFKIRLDKDELEHFILSLPPSEQHAILILFPDKDNSHTSASLRVQVIKNMPMYVVDHIFLLKKSFNYFPSCSLQLYLLSKISDKPMRFLPGFGVLGNLTLFYLHQAGYHFYPLYALEVKNQMTKPHKTECGPFTSAKHDEGHIFWASLFEEEQRFQIFDLVSQLLEMSSAFESSPRFDKSKKHIEKIAYQGLNDLVPFPLKKTMEMNQEEFFNFFIKVCFSIEETDQDVRLVANYFYDLIPTKVTDLFFLIAKKYFSDETSEMWRFIYFSFKNTLNLAGEKESSPDRKSDIDKVINALEILAKMSVNPDNKVTKKEYSGKVNWHKWAKKFHSNATGEEIWEWAANNKKRHKEFLDLIHDHRIDFFPPYLPLTIEKRKSFIDFIEINMPSKKLKLIAPPVGLLPTGFSIFAQSMSAQSIVINKVRAQIEGNGLFRSPIISING